MSPFETKRRDNGETLVTLKDDAPEWLKEAVQAAHQEDFPDDWIFVECEAAFDAITEGRLDGDGVHEYADGRVDIYTQDLFQWAANMCHSNTFAAAEGTADDLGLHASDDGIVTRLTKIQYCAIAYIAEVMLNAYKEKDE